jgi:hypothetical protein
MRISNANQYSTPDNLVWYFLAEFSLSKFLSDSYRGDELTVGLLFQTMRELGMPLECVKNIAMLVNEFAKESPAHYKQEVVEFPAWIRIFCQKKIIDEANAARATAQPYHAEQATKHSPMIPDTGMKMKGGWGCFLIERGGGGSSTGASGGLWNSVDLYLYKEGE